MTGLETGYPSGHVLYRRLQKRYPRIVRGEGCWLEDAGGRRYLDACSGALVTNLGHGNAEVARAVGEQAARLAYVNGTAFTHDAVEELAAEVAALSAQGLDRTLFLCNGGDAVEAALKIARQFWAESGRPEKRRIVALSPSYHGNTLLPLSASGEPGYRDLLRDWLVEVERAPAPYAYRCSCRGAVEECPACSGAAVEEALLRAGPESVAAFIAEPVGGISTGASVPRPGYWRRVREICDRPEVRFGADADLTGAGRTGHVAGAGALRGRARLPGPRQGDRGRLRPALGARDLAPHRRRARCGLRRSAAQPDVLAAPGLLRRRSRDPPRAQGPRPRRALRPH